MQWNSLVVKENEDAIDDDEWNWRDYEISSQTFRGDGRSVWC